MTPTFSRTHWDAALQAWKAGGFGPEWSPWRHEAAMRGMIYPPTGTKWDAWDDDQPSERAMIVRAMRDTPALLHRAIADRKSWAGVVAYVIRERDDWRAELARAERYEVRDGPDPREATVALKRIIDRIRES